MADQIRRSGRATKGQHKNASSSPAPNPKPTKSAKSKAPKKSLEPTPTQEETYDDDEEVIRCICSDTNPKDKRAFIGCDDCDVWQHNVCMGMPDDEEEVPDSYLCEECGPQDHQETIQALARGEHIWETRNKIYQNERKMSKHRKGKTGKAGWLKKNVAPAEDVEDGDVPKSEEAAASSQETGSKRKRGGDEPKEEEPPQQDVKMEEAAEDKKSARGAARQDKRRKSAPPPDDPATALVPIDQLPADRQKIAQALVKVLSESIKTGSESGALRVPDGQIPQSLAAHHASRIEYALLMNHESVKSATYGIQFRALLANLKTNPSLIERLLQGSLTADELSTMSTADMASDQLQKERAMMKEQLDRQAVAVQQEGPRYRRTHKGDELIEDVEMTTADSGRSVTAPVRERTSIADAEMVEGGAGSPTATRVDGSADSPTTTKQPAETPLRLDTKRRESTSISAPGHERRQSSQQFDMNSIWAKTAQSPTSATAPRPFQMPPRRRSSQPIALPQDTGGTKEDADIDRMLQDDDETYSPIEDSSGEVVWRGKLVQSADSVSPTVNARFVAGRDLAPTVAWRDLLPENLSIDGRLAVPRAEEYLCSLQWSQSTDVSVLALTPYDDAEGFEAVFNYFKSRQRYGVVNKSKPTMVKDLYIIPLEQGEELPAHVGLLEYCRLKERVEERCVLASVVVSRALPDAAIAAANQQQPPQTAEETHQLPPGAVAGVNGHQLPQHMRPSAPGPSGSPLNATSATFSPTGGPPHAMSSFPPNPYTDTPPAHPHPNPLVTEILGTLQYAPTAQQVVAADPNISREKLEHLRQIMEEDLNARTDINALAVRLGTRG